MEIWESDTFLARWLNDELSPEEKEAFERSEDFQHYQQIKAGMELYEAPAYDEEAAWQQALGNIRQQPQGGKVLSMRTLLRYGAAASILVATCLAIYVTFLSDEIISLTATQQQDIDLPDGSSIALSEGAFIQYNASEWEENRTVELKGEAFFEVEKGTSFQVELAKGTVSVLGTSFNILEKENALEVVCYTGKVKVEAFEESQVITAGQSVEIQVGTVQLDSVYLREPVWVDRVASYHQVKLGKVLQQLTQWYDVKIIGEYDSQLLYTGQFPTDDIEVALTQIFGPFNLQYDYSDSTREVRLLTP